MTPCRKLLQFNIMGDIKCRLPRPGVAFANAVIMIDISFIILKAKRVRNFPASLFARCWTRGVWWAVCLMGRRGCSALVTAVPLFTAPAQFLQPPVSQLSPRSHRGRLGTGLCCGIVSIIRYRRGYREAGILLVSWQTSVWTYAFSV